MLLKLLMLQCFTGPSAPTARSDSIPLTERARLTLLPLCSTSLRGSEIESNSENPWLCQIFTCQLKSVLRRYVSKESVVLRWWGVLQDNLVLSTELIM